MSEIPLWRRIQKENFTRIGPLLDFLEMNDTLREKFLTSPRFPLNLPRRLAEKIAKNTLDDPILRQFLPLQEETLPTLGFSSDPTSDQTFRKTKKLLHKYKGRALIVTTSSCVMNCRFCFRQNFPYETDIPGFKDEIEYLAQDASLSEVILSGGDPLSLSDTTLAALFAEFEKIPHIRRIRFHSRFPIGIPERIDTSFLDLLAASTKQIYFVLHSNHPLELDPEVIAALRKMKSIGATLLNQSVLLKGVNDSPDVLVNLCETLINAGILPYYLHELDPVEGSSHFALPGTRGPELIRHLQSHLSGYGVPQLVREIPGYPSKTFIKT